MSEEIPILLGRILALEAQLSDAKQALQEENKRLASVLRDLSDTTLKLARAEILLDEVLRIWDSKTQWYRPTNELKLFISKMQPVIDAIRRVKKSGSS